MDLKIIFIYCFCDDLLKSLSIKNDPQCKMNYAEIMTLAIASTMFFYGNFSLTRQVFISKRFCYKMLGNSRLIRRLHEIDTSIWDIAFVALSKIFKAEEKGLEYLIDSFPVEVCMNIRSYRCKLLAGKKFIGFCKAKKKFYYGFKVHMITNTQGKPIEFLITEASMADITALKLMNIELPCGSTIYADKAYTDYKFEDELFDIEAIRLIAERKSIHKRQHSSCLQFLQSYKRKRIETAFSGLTSLFPKKISAVTKQGFLLKLLLFILSFTLQQLN